MLRKAWILVVVLGFFSAACGRSAGKRADAGWGGDALLPGSTGGGGGEGGSSQDGVSSEATAGGNSGALPDAASRVPDAQPDRAIDSADADEVAAACGQTSDSNLPGVSLVFLDDRCTFTLAEAAAGISFTFAVKVLHTLKSIDTVASDTYGRCKGPEQTNPFIVGYDIVGGSQRYSPWFDTGRCTRQQSTFEAVEGESYQEALIWHGCNYLGPSDTGRREGEPFPPGSYTVTLSTEGTWRADDGGSTSFQVVATRTIILTP